MKATCGKEGGKKEGVQILIFHSPNTKHLSRCVFGRIICFPYPATMKEKQALKRNSRFENTFMRICTRENTQQWSRRDAEDLYIYTSLAEQDATRG